MCILVEFVVSRHEFVGSSFHTARGRV